MDEEQIPSLQDLGFDQFGLNPLVPQTNQDTSIDTDNLIQSLSGTKVSFSQITGSIIQTADNNQRIVLDGINNQIQFYANPDPLDLSQSPQLGATLKSSVNNAGAILDITASCIWYVGVPGITFKVGTVPSGTDISITPASGTITAGTFSGTNFSGEFMGTFTSSSNNPGITQNIQYQDWGGGFHTLFFENGLLVGQV